MKKFLWVSLMIVFSTAFNAHAVLIDFDTLPDGQILPARAVLSDQYSDWGVTFSGFEDGIEVDTGVDNYYGSSPAGGNYWTNGPPVNAGWGDNRRRDILRVSFTSIARDIEFEYWKSSSIYRITFNFYGTSNQLLGSEMLGTDTWAPVSFSHTGVSYFEMLQPTENLRFAVDNLKFEVPEQATVVLIGIGFLGLVGISRRKFKE